VQSKCKNLKNQNMAKVLILEQSKSMRNILRERLEFEGFATAVAERDELSESMVARRGYDAILAGSETEQVSALGVPFIIVTHSGSIDGAVAAVLDIDSPLTGRFTEADKEGLESLVPILESIL
jgi:DNA-binding NtrC family response regulator